MKLSAALQDRMIDQVAFLIDRGNAPGMIRIYDGARPVTAETGITSQKLLAVLKFSRVSFRKASGGVATANAILPAFASETGTASWARVCDARMRPVFDCDLGLSDSSADIKLSALELEPGRQVQIESFSIGQRSNN